MITDLLVRLSRQFHFPCFGFRDADVSGVVVVITDSLVRGCGCRCLFAVTSVLKYQRDHNHYQDKGPHERFAQGAEESPPKSCFADLPCLLFVALLRHLTDHGAGQRTEAGEEQGPDNWAHYRDGDAHENTDESSGKGSNNCEERSAFASSLAFDPERSCQKLDDVSQKSERGEAADDPPVSEFPHCHAAWNFIVDAISVDRGSRYHQPVSRQAKETDYQSEETDENECDRVDESHGFSLNPSVLLQTV